MEMDGHPGDQEQQAMPDARGEAGGIGTVRGSVKGSGEPDANTLQQPSRHHGAEQPPALEDPAAGTTKTKAAGAKQPVAGPPKSGAQQGRGAAAGSRLGTRCVSLPEATPQPKAAGGATAGVESPTGSPAEAAKKRSTAQRKGGNAAKVAPSKARKGAGKTDGGPGSPADAAAESPTGSMRKGGVERGGARRLAKSPAKAATGRGGVGGGDRGGGSGGGGGGKDFKADARKPPAGTKRKARGDAGGGGCGATVAVADGADAAPKRARRDTRTSPRLKQHKQGDKAGDGSPDEPAWMRVGARAQASPAVRPQKRSGADDAGEHHGPAREPLKYTLRIRVSADAHIHAANTARCRHCNHAHV